MQENGILRFTGIVEKECGIQKQLKHQRMKIQIKPFLRLNQQKVSGIPASGAVSAAKSKHFLKILKYLVMLLLQVDGKRYSNKDMA